MRRNPTYLETGLSDYLRGTASAAADDLLLRALADNEELDVDVEIAVIPGYSKSDLDAMWISNLNNARLGCQLEPGPNLHRFFELLNVHPRDVFTGDMLSVVPAEVAPHLDDHYRQWINQCNFTHVRGYFDLIETFKVNEARIPLCTPDLAREVIQNATYGGVPVISGFMKMKDVMSLDFEHPIQLSGRYQMGIWDNVNGSGHMESATETPFELKLDKGDLMVWQTQGWTPDQSCGFVRRFYTLNLSTVQAIA